MTKPSTSGGLGYNNSIMGQNESNNKVIDNNDLETLQDIRFQAYKIPIEINNSEITNSNDKKFKELDERITQLIIRLDCITSCEQVIKTDKKELIIYLQSLAKKLTNLVTEKMPVDENQINEEMKIDTIKKYSRWLITVNILGVKVNALCDSGASHTFMGENLYRQLKHQNHSIYRIPMERVQIANKEIVYVDKVMSVPMQIGMKGTLYPVRYLPNLSNDLIIGLDILKSMEIMIDTAIGSWFYKSHPETIYYFTDECSETTFQDKIQCTGIMKLNEEEKQVLDKLITKTKESDSVGYPPTNLMQHEIKLTDYTPVFSKPRRENPKMQKIIEQYVDEMLENDIIEPSTSNFSSNILMVPKPDNTFRPCVDFRKLNQVTLRDAYPLPVMDQIMCSLESCRYLSKIDLTKAFWLIPLTENCKHLTAFAVPHKGFYQFKRLPFGTVNSSSVFQRLLDRVIGNDLLPYVHRYIDDIIIATDTFERMYKILEIIFQRLRDANLKINWTKSEFGMDSIEFLGFIVDDKGLRVNEKKTESVRLMNKPSNVKQLRRILGMITWYKKFIPNLSSKTKVLTQLLSKNVK